MNTINMTPRCKHCHAEYVGDEDFCSQVCEYFFYKKRKDDEEYKRKRRKKT